MSQPSPLWYTSRGLGMTLLVLLTANVVLGIMTNRGWQTEGWPRFLTSELHRNISLLALVLLPLHGLTVILDSYAHLGLRDILVPFATNYRPLWLGLGVLAGELIVAVVAVSLVRRHLGYRLWRFTHWGAYVAWPLAVLHGLGTGSDPRYPWALLMYVVCVAAVLLAVLVRLSLHRPGVTAGRLLAGMAVSAGVLALAIFTMLGPLQPGWAAAAGTPANLLGGNRTAAATPSPSPSGSAPPSTPAPTPTPSALPAGLDDPMQVQVSSSDAGQQVTLTDQRDPSIQVTVLIGQQAATGPLEVRRSGQVVCRTQANLDQQITAACGGTSLTIGLYRQRGGLTGEMITGPGDGSSG